MSPALGKNYFSRDRRWTRVTRWESASFG